MKSLFCFLTLALACVGNVLAWEPVIKETHWFGMYEYEDYTNGQWGWSPFDTKRINWSDNYIESIEVAKSWTNQSPLQLPKTTYYSWLDRKLRFSVDRTELWDVDRNTSNNYKGLGLYNKGDGGTNFWIHNLKQGDKFNVEYYRDPNNNNSPFLVSGSVEGRTPGQNYSGDNAIYGAANNSLVYYTMTADGDVEINIPSHTVIRSVTIQHVAYEKATFQTEQITDNGNIGYKTTMTGAGVLEDKRGAIPYMTMRFGAENDMTFVRNVGDPGNGVTYYAASNIVDESNDFNPSTAKLQAPYRSKSEADMKRFLANKEWSVFTANPDGNGGDDFNSIYPLYGSYYYFFPEVNGKLIMEFYCEGSEETPAFWYKKRADGSFPGSNDQPAVTKVGVNNNGRTSGGNFYRFTVDVDKGGVYYLCSLPTNIAHEHPIIRLISYAFIPAFRLDPLWYIATDEEKASGTIAHAAETNQDFTVTTDHQSVNLIKSVKCEGNIASAEPYFEGKVLKFKNIKYKSETENDPTLNDGGAVIVNVECASGKATYVLTVPYTAEKAVKSTDANNHLLRVMDPDKENNPDGKQVKKWDFFSNVYNVGQYKNTSSQLYNEIHKADGLTADWVDTYMDLENEKERIFKSVYDMEGDNADMIKETEGLVFFTETNQLGIFNENDPSNSEFRDRYIGLMGGEMWIPNLKAGDRIVLKMGRYGKDSQGADKAHLTITGAKDAIGNPITGDYVIGGSGVAAGNDLNNGADITDPSQPWGEYHFISTGGHFKLEVTDATLLKLYSIVIYKHDDTILTENELLGDEDHLEILNTKEFVTPDNVLLRLHYRGLKEATNYSAPVEAKTGNLVKSDVHVSNQTSYESLWYTYSVDLPESPAAAKFGVFKARQGVKTIGEDYVTDYADCMIPVGYRETLKYPYTWDFTDLKKYVSAGIDENGTEKEVADADLKLWKEWNMRVMPEEWDGTIFSSGGQLYGGKTMFDETRGIGIIHDYTNTATMTGTTTDETGGLSVSNGAYGFIVPQVDKGEAIYVRAKSVGGTQKHKYEMSDGTTSYAYGQAEKDFTYSATVDGEEVFAVVMPSSLTKKVDVKLSFQGYEVKKIAVSTDSKAVNSKGWTSESRDHAIDASLLPYFTGKEMKTYVVSDPNYTERTLTLTDVGAEAKCVIPAGTGCLIYNTDNGAFNPFGTDEEGKGDGFHLFVPDMHDQTGKASELDNLLIPNVDTEQLTLGMFDGSNVNYVLAYKYQLLKSDGTPYGDIIEGPEMFYRVSNKGIKLHKNSAYLKLPKDMVMPSKDNPTGHAKFTFFFAEPSETTAIEFIESLFGEEMAGKPATWYNLNGQKLNGKPTKGGLYIVNGKKVLVK